MVRLLLLGYRREARGKPNKLRSKGGPREKCWLLSYRVPCTSNVITMFVRTNHGMAHAHVVSVPRGRASPLGNGRRELSFNHFLHPHAQRAFSIQRLLQTFDSVQNFVLLTHRRKTRVRAVR